MTKLCLLGYGRMGKMIHSLAENEDFSVEYIYDGKKELDIKKLKKCDVAIDFSLPSSAFININTCIENNLPVVSGTTGWLENLPKIQETLSQHKDSAFLYGSNFSIGANIFFMLNSYLANLMSNQNYELGITEIHHTKKLDAPSGTAITIAKDIIENHPKKSQWVNNPSDSIDTVPIISIREEDVKGTHIVKYENHIDEISIEHKANSREGFALGALKAAKWLIGKNGYFTINDFVKEELSKL